MSLGSTIKQIRTAKKIPQIQLARNLNIGNNYLSRIELGKDIPSIQLVEQIAIHLNIPAPILLFLTLEPEDCTGNPNLYLQCKLYIDILKKELL